MGVQPARWPVVLFWTRRALPGRIADLGSVVRLVQSPVVQFPILWLTGLA
jgi:hypothetical protein